MREFLTEPTTCAPSFDENQLFRGQEKVRHSFIALNSLHASVHGL
jgi:hypothetical protein